MYGFDYDDAPSEYRTRRTVYRCGGYASSTGHCGATDCETCYPGCSTRGDRELSDIEERLQSVGYKQVGYMEWEKQVSTKVHVARRDHADGTVKAGQRYRVTTTRYADGETGKSYLKHQKVMLS